MSNSNYGQKMYGIRYLLKYLTPYKWLLLIVLIALLATSSSFLLLSRAVGHVIDNGLIQQNVAMLNASIAYFVFLILILAIATAFRFFFITLIGEMVIRDIRRDVYNQVLRLSLDFYESNKSGEILARLTTDTTLLQSIIGNSISVAARNTVMLIGSFIMLLLANFKLTVCMFSILPMVLIPIIFFGRKMRNFAKIAQEKVASLSAISEETIGYIKTIQAYHSEEYEKKTFEEKLTEALLFSTTRIRTRSILVFVIISLIFCGIAFVLWIGGNDVIAGHITGGELSSFIILSVICAGTMAALTEVFGEFQKAIGASERLMEFLDIKPSVEEKISSTLAEQKTFDIKFSDVTFHYPSKKDTFVFQNLSFEVQSNKIVAIVGSSGAGKSTIFNLLLRFYNIQSGTITLNNIDINSFSLQELRSNFAYVSQDPVVFSKSALENIKYGNPNASFDQVREAAKNAAALDFIEQLPEKFDTFLGEKGVRLSGGQKQRIAIARAFLKDPKILLLDEATSALDSVNEKLVQKAVDKLMENRTTIIVAHRLSTIKNADMILVMKEGRIVENGNHTTLIKQSGEYTKLLNASTTM